MQLNVEGYKMGGAIIHEGTSSPFSSNKVEYGDNIACTHCTFNKGGFCKFFTERNVAVYGCNRFERKAE